MKFYALLCVLIAASLLVTPAAALIGSHKETADVPPAVTLADAETSTESSQTNQDR